MESFRSSSHSAIHRFSENTKHWCDSLYRFLAAQARFVESYSTFEPSKDIHQQDLKVYGIVNESQQRQLAHVILFTFRLAHQQYQQDNEALVNKWTEANALVHQLETILINTRNDTNLTDFDTRTNQRF